MNKFLLQSLRQSLVVVAVSTVFAACADEAPVAPAQRSAMSAQVAKLATAEDNATLALLRSVTARYHDLNAALADDFVLLHECESRPGEGPVGAVYVHMGRLLDGRIDPASPDALIYAPGPNGQSVLAGAEFAIPYGMWTGSTPPQFMGATFQPEDEFGVFALHAWIWLNNPEGMFAETNPRISCGEA